MANKILVDDNVQVTIRRRAQHARTKSELVASLFDSFRHLQIDPWEISLEEMKIAIVVAGCAVRESSGESPLNMPV